MIVAQYWAEGRLQQRDGKRQITVRRFGWSDASQVEAQAHADERTREAMRQVLAGDKIERRERKLAYNGAQGMPIREEIVSRHGDAVVTRNGYGARCLNTPNVLFADIDFELAWSPRWYGGVFVALGLCAIVGTAWTRSVLATIGLFVLAALLAIPLAAFLRRTVIRLRGGVEAIARLRVEGFVARHPAWGLRMYHTPAGLRLLATHAMLDPRDASVQQALQALGVDPLYARMCVHQGCFRARVSAKPWRIGIGEHLRPRPGVWPVAPQKLAARRAWVEHYEAAARGFAACRFECTLGAAAIHPDAWAVQQLHDELCRATQDLPLA
jgi:hypothetical protein